MAGGVVSNEERLADLDALRRRVTALEQEKHHLLQTLARAQHDRHPLPEQLDLAAFTAQGYNLLAHYISDVIWTTDLAFRPISISPAVERLRGYTPEEVLRQSAEEFLTPGSLAFARQVLKAAIASGQTNLERLVDLEILCKDGSTVWTESAIAILRDKQGQPTGLIGVTRDITERKRLEAQLRQSQKLEAVGTLAGGIAHDMNNVLGVVMGLASVLQNRLDPESPLHKHVEGILSTARQGRDLTRNLLGFARKGRFQREAVMLNNIVEEVHALLQRTIPKSIVVRTELRGNLDLVEGDPAQLNHVLMNLCLNACDAMVTGGTLTIVTENETVEDHDAQAHPDLKPGRYVLLRVIDTGPGMPAEIREHAFEPFYTTKPKGRGTGLGLSMVYGTVTNHGGAVILESEPGQGTTVTVFLPALSGEVKFRRPTPSPVPVSLRRGTVLLVDDEHWFRYTGERMLADLGYEVITVASGDAAVKEYEQRGSEIGLVILDLLMPGMDGEETFRQLRALDPDATVMLCSGFSREDKAERVLRAGAVGYLQKPFDMQRLAKKLGKIMDR